MAAPITNPTCFMAMPITTRPEDAERYGGDSDHWLHVMESLFEKSIEHAGFQPIRPAAQGAHLIHGMIIHHLSTADLVLVDLSAHNPNVFFELGVRTSLNLPIALVRDEHTSIPFDTSGINTYTYSSALRGWEMEEQKRSLAEHVKESAISCAGANPLWRQFGLTIKAHEPETKESPLEAKVDLLGDRFLSLQRQMQEELARLETERDRSFFLSDPSWAGRQLADSARTPPAQLFAAAVERAFGGTSKFLVAELGLNRAAVLVDGNVTQNDVTRLNDLARRYEVGLEIEHSSETRARAKTRNVDRSQRED